MTRNFARASAEAKLRRWGWAGLVDLGDGQKWQKVLYLCRKVGPRQVGIVRFGEFGRWAKVAKMMYLCRKVGPRQVGMGRFGGLG